jgi:hypothetical protein
MHQEERFKFCLHTRNNRALPFDPACPEHLSVLSLASLLYSLFWELPSPNGFIVHKAQLLNILTLESSSSQQRNFHGYKVPSEYTVQICVG